MYLMQMEIPHPTKANLIETATELLKEFKSGDITADMVLTRSNISKGSLYHHFDDLEELIETALLARYAKWVDRSVSTMTPMMLNAKTDDDFYAGLVQATYQTQHRDLKKERFFRVEVLAKANSSKRFAEKLQALQQRLTDTLEDIIREAQERGFFTKSLDPKAIAVFIQAYSLGKVLDDLSETPVNTENYNELINTIIRKVFIAK
jgi:AcrR family transcriptional regulator